MNEHSCYRKQLKSEAINILLTAKDGSIPLLGHMTAVMLWLFCALGVKYVLDGLPLEIPAAVGDILRSGVTLPMAVGVVRCISDGGNITAVLEPFGSVTSYTEAWKAALMFTAKLLRSPKLILLNLGLLWHIVPILLTAGLWLFVFIPYSVTLNSLYLRDLKNVKNK